MSRQNKIVIASLAAGVLMAALIQILAAVVHLWAKPLPAIVFIILGLVSLILVIFLGWAVRKIFER